MGTLTRVSSQNPSVGRSCARHTTTFAMGDDLQRRGRSVILNRLRVSSGLGMATSRERTGISRPNFDGVLETPAVFKAQETRLSGGKRNGLTGRNKSLQASVAVWLVVTSSARKGKLYPACQATADTLVQRGVDTRAACDRALQI